MKKVFLITVFSFFISIFSAYSSSDNLKFPIKLDFSFNDSNQERFNPIFITINEDKTIDISMGKYKNLLHYTHAKIKFDSDKKFLYVKSLKTKIKGITNFILSFENGVLYLNIGCLNGYSSPFKIKKYNRNVLSTMEIPSSIEAKDRLHFLRANFDIYEKNKTGDEQERAYMVNYVKNSTHSDESLNLKFMDFEYRGTGSLKDQLEKQLPSF